MMMRYTLLFFLVAGIFSGNAADKEKIDVPLRFDRYYNLSEVEEALQALHEAFPDFTVIHVPEGTRKPYRCAGGFYIRNGASSQKMNTEEIINFIQNEQRYNFDEQYDSRYPENDFDRDKYKAFIRKCKISGEYNPEDVIVNLGMASFKNNNFILNNTGMLFLGRNPERFLPHSAITCVLYKGNIKLNVLDRKDFSADLISNIEDALVFLKKPIIRGLYGIHTVVLL